MVLFTFSLRFIFFCKFSETGEPANRNVLFFFHMCILVWCVAHAAWGGACGENTCAQDSVAGAWGRYKNMYELLNLIALKFSMLHETDIFRCMGNRKCQDHVALCILMRVPRYMHKKVQTVKNTFGLMCNTWNGKSVLRPQRVEAGRNNCHPQERK